MKRTILVVTLAITAVAAGCSSGGTSASNPTPTVGRPGSTAAATTTVTLHSRPPGTSPATSSSSSTVVSASEEELTALLPQLKRAGLTCPAPHAYESGPDDISVGANPIEEATCTSSDGQTVSASRWLDEPTRQRAWQGAVDFACRYGVTAMEWIASGATVIRVKGTGGAMGVATEAHALDLRLSSALSAPVSSHTC